MAHTEREYTCKTCGTHQFWVGAHLVKWGVGPHGTPMCASCTEAIHGTPPTAPVIVTQHTTPYVAYCEDAANLLEELALVQLTPEMALRCDRAVTELRTVARHLRQQARRHR